MTVITNERQLDLFNTNVELIKRGTKYALLIMVAQYEHHEWHERYICKFDSIGNDAELTFEALKKVHSDLSLGHITNTAYGKQLKIDGAVVWFAHKKIRYSEAKTIMDLRLLPFLNLCEKGETK